MKPTLQYAVASTGGLSSRRSLSDYEALDQSAANDALRIPIERSGASITEDALNFIFQQTQGYPYFIQEWGKEAWNISEGPVIEVSELAAVQDRVLAGLDRNFFRVRFDRLTPLEQQYLLALAELGPGSQRSGDVARQLQVSTNRLGPRRDALVKKGMIYSPTYGDVAFTVPLFDDFMKRAMETEK